MSSSGMDAKVRGVAAMVAPEVSGTPAQRLSVAVAAYRSAGLSWEIPLFVVAMVAEDRAPDRGSYAAASGSSV